jgi:hypothetical protein
VASYTDGQATFEKVTSAPTAAVTNVSDPGVVVIDSPVDAPPVTNLTNPSTVDIESPTDLAKPQTAPQDTVSSPLSNQTATSPNTAGKATEQKEIPKEEAQGETVPSSAPISTDSGSLLLRKDSLSTIETARAERAIPVQERDLRLEVPVSVMQASDYEHVRDSLDAVKQEVTSDNRVGNVYLGSAIVSSIGLSVGYVAWLLRGGMLLASLLSSAPAWQIVDPLPILGGKKDDDHSDDDESLESILNKKPQQKNQKNRTADASSDAEAKRQ